MRHSSKSYKDILIYDDQGARPACVQETFNSFQAFLGNSYNIQTVSASYIKQENWEKNTALIVMPGGRSAPYYETLANGGNEKIINFVNNGGKYLGICAGAYYGCAVTEFEKGNELEIICKGVLNFFPGIAAGPANALGKFQYESYAGAEIINIKWQESAVVYPVFFQGGCYFVAPEKYANTKVLGHYTDLMDNPAAIIACQVGQGTALLSGVHFEFSAAGIDVTAEGGFDLKSVLAESQQQRAQLLQKIILILIS